MKRRLLREVSFWLAASILVAGTGLARGAGMLHHLHGLAFIADNQGLVAAGHVGLWIYRDARWARAAGPAHDFMGFSVTRHAMYSSGHPAPNTSLRDPLGLVKSADGGKSWSEQGLSGEAEFHVMTAGYDSNAIYVLNVAPNSRLRQPGLYVTRNEGKSWKPCAAAGLPSSILRLAAHPSSASTLAAATLEGVYISYDFGATFSRIGPEGPISAVRIDFDGSHLYFARGSPDRLKRAALGGGRMSVIALPEREETDFVAYIAQNPVQLQELAIGTRRRNIFVSPDGGKTWRQIARWGAAL